MSGAIFAALFYFDRFLIRNLNSTIVIVFITSFSQLNAIIRTQLLIAFADIIF